MCLKFLSLICGYIIFSTTFFVKGDNVSNNEKN